MNSYISKMIFFSVSVLNVPKPALFSQNRLHSKCWQCAFSANQGHVETSHFFTFPFLSCYRHAGAHLTSRETKSVYFQHKRGCKSSRGLIRYINWCHKVSICGQLHPSSPPPPHIRVWSQPSVVCRNVNCQHFILATGRVFLCWSWPIIYCKTIS